MHLRVRGRAVRSLAVVAAAAALPVLGLPAVALADDGLTAGDTVVGQLVQAWPEHADPQQEYADAPLSWIKTGSGDAVRVETSDVSHVPVGSTVQVTVGGQVRDTAAAEGMEPARDVLAADVVATAPATPAPAAGTTPPVTDTVTVVMVQPPGAVRDSRTLADVENAVAGPVHDFWAAQSGGAIQLGVDTAGSHDWISTTDGCSDPFALWNEVAGDVGFTPGPGKHLMLYVTSDPTDTSACSYGLAEVGTGLGSGGYLYVRDTITSVIAHELGHNFGLGHSSEKQCDGAVEFGTCQTASYMDLYDVMGASWDQVGSLNAPQAARLGFLPAAQQQTVDPSAGAATYTLSPYGGSSGNRAVKLVSPSGAVYWLEYRTATGQDSWLGSSSTDPYRLDSGVLLRQATSGPDTSLLLDGTPSAESDWDYDFQEALPVGRQMSFANGAYTVAVIGETSTGATVQVSTLAGDARCVEQGSVPASGVALAVTGSSSVLAFGVGGDHAVWYRPVSYAGGWQTLGGMVRYGPAAAAWSTMSFVFAVGWDGALYQRVAAANEWGPWLSLGGYLTSSPAVASLGDGHLRVFARGGDGQLWSREYANGAWAAWMALGGAVASAPSATADPYSRLVDVSVRGTDGRIWTLGLPVGAGAGYVQSNFSACSALALPAASSSATQDGSVYLDADGEPWVTARDGGGATGPLGGRLTSTPAVQYPGTSRVVAGTGSDGALWVYDSRPGGVGGWVSLGGRFI